MTTTLVSAPVATVPALIVLDMAGTTVIDDGIVEQAFARAAERSGLPITDPDAALQYVRDTMGQSKIDVFTHLAGGDRAAAERANAAFEAAYRDLIAEVGVSEIDGAGEVIAGLAAAGVPVVLTTGFAPDTRDAILAALPWAGAVTAALSPVDAGRGRPAPDLVLTAVVRAQAPSLAATVVVGDTASDVESGRRAGAGLVVGVLTGAHDRAALEAAGADAVIDGIRDLPALLAARGL
ncbi:HAD hydrolase-like protein [Microbacterium sp. W1N]|uniref:HAD family hydrolase n=1 Tax=Microbacterium festucae TaxID=2977531 RepID=UPI0021BFD681|nr:HAD family hydrolase [Microbacterium festucae]MCT9820936.1 HAD hydrolase-like protein [Microbacterium festucae]